MIPERHRQFVEDVLARHGVPPLPPDTPRPSGLIGWTNQAGNDALAGTPMGQIVGRMNSIRSTRDVVFDLVDGAVRAIEQLHEQLCAPNPVGDR